MATPTRVHRPLQSRHYHLLVLLAQDLTVRQVARETGVPEETARSRIVALHARYGTGTRLALVLTAMARGDLDPASVLGRYRTVPADAEAVPR